MGKEVTVGMFTLYEVRCYKDEENPERMRARFKLLVKGPAGEVIFNESALLKLQKRTGCFVGFVVRNDKKVFVIAHDPESGDTEYQAYDAKK